MFRFSRCDKGEVDVYRFMSNIVQIFCHMPFHTLPLVEPLGTLSKLMQIPDDGIIKNMNSSLDSYSMNGQTA